MSKGSFIDSFPYYVKSFSVSKQLDYAINQLQWMEENCEDDESNKRLRRAAMEAAEHFSLIESGCYDDERLLKVFCMVGKLSRSFGMKSVMEELFNRKQFRTLAEFYVKWAEIYAVEKDRHKFDEIWTLATDANALPRSRLDEAFRAMIHQYFEMDDEPTANIFRKIEKNVQFEFDNAKKITKSAEQKKTDANEKKSKKVLLVIDEEISVEELYAGTLPQNRLSTMSVSKLSAISEERSVCSSGSSVNPSFASDISKPVNLADSNLAEVRADAMECDDPNPESECPKTIAEGMSITADDEGIEIGCPASPYTLLGGTSFTERFYNKAMRDFSSTVPVPPPRSMHHNDEPTILHDTVSNTTELMEPEHCVPKKANFDIYEEEDSIKEDSQSHQSKDSFCDHSDENADPKGSAIKRSLEVDMEADVSMKNPDDEDVKEEEFKKPQLIPRKAIGKKGKEISHGETDDSEMTHEVSDFSYKYEEETVAGYLMGGKGRMVTSTPANILVPSHREPIADQSFRPMASAAADGFFDLNAQQEGTAFAKRMSLSKDRHMSNIGRLSQKIGPENIAVSKMGIDAGDINDDMRRLSIVKDQDLEPTGKGLISMITSGVNPWCNRLRDKIMKKTRFCPTNLHDFEENLSKPSVGGFVMLGGERFDVQSILGEGGFAKVYKCLSEDGNTYALKFEIPPCRWEAYICEALRLRSPKDSMLGVMSIRDTYIYQNASAIVYQYHDQGNLLDLVNNMKTNRSSCTGLLASYLGWQMARIIKEVHEAKIIHADVKPDNFMILKRMDENSSTNEITSKGSYVLKLIDWGRSIDMSHLEGQVFIGKAGTDTFDCFEMQSNSPWTYQTDFYGFASTLHVVIFGEYMETFHDSGRNKTVSVIKSRWPESGMLKDIFDMCLNIADCDSLPRWSTIVDGLERNIKSSSFDRIAWKNAARIFNSALPRV